MTRDDWQDREFASIWDETGNLRSNPDRLNQLALLAELLAASATTHLLDLGIGSAQVELAIARRHPDFFKQCRVTGLDASQAMLDMAAKRCRTETLQGIELRQGDFSAIDAFVLDSSPDAVICVQALHEVPHETKRSVFRWVRDNLPAGRPFYVLDRFAYRQGEWMGDWRAVWNWLRSGVAEEVMTFDDYHRTYQAKTDYVATVEEYRRWLRDAGFETTCPYRCFNRAMIIARS